MLSSLSRYIICSVGIVFCCQFSNDIFAKHLGFGFDNEKKSVKIPFKSHDNLIIIEAILDGKNKLNLILDTGIRSLVLFEQSYIPTVSKNMFDIMFTGAGNIHPIKASVSISHNLRLSEDVVANQINAVILNRSNENLHEIHGTKIHGAFGYQLFTRFQVKIDYKKQLITLIEPFKTSCFDGFQSIPISIQDTKPFVKANFISKNNRWKELNLLLDLGANHKILLHDHVNIKSLNLHLANEHKIAEGLGGSIYGQKGLSRSIRLGSVVFHDTEVLIPTRESYYNESLSKIGKHGSIGGKLFNKSTIILDYINGYLFIQNGNIKIRDLQKLSS